jgi:nitrogen-specific signal transduction histidine kinase
MRHARAPFFVAASVALLGAAAAAPAEEVDVAAYLEQFQGFLKEILQINIRAKVLSNNEQLLWEAKKQAFTVPGLEVEVRIPSENLVVLAYFTPVRLNDGRILLQVHAEVWAPNVPRETGKARYTTTINYIPAGLGDKIRFYPLGEFPALSARGNLDANLCNLELEIQIVPYTTK